MTQQQLRLAAQVLSEMTPYDLAETLGEDAQSLYQALDAIWWGTDEEDV